MKKLVTVALSTFLAFSSFAGTLDVRPNHKLLRGDAYVRVTKLNNNRIKFEKCISGLEENCENLGKKSSYSLKELRTQRSEENREIAYSAAGDVALVAAAVFGGLEVAAPVASLVSAVGVGAEFQTLVVMGIAFGGPQTLAIASIVNFDVLNPLEQARQAKTLNENIITDKNVTIDNNDMNDFIERLDLVLSKI